MLADFVLSIVACHLITIKHLNQLISQINTDLSNKIKLTTASFTMSTGVGYDVDYEADDVFAFAVLDTNTVDRNALTTWSVTAERKVKFISTVAQNAVFTIVHIK